MNDRFRRVPGHGDAGAPPQFVVEHPMIIVPKTQAMWRSPRRIYLDSKGEPVEHGHPDAHSLLVPEGGEIPLERAQQLGLLEADKPEGEEPSALAQEPKAEDEPLSDEELEAIAEERGFVLVAREEYDRLKALEPSDETNADLNDDAFDVPGLPHQAVDALKNAGLWSAEALRAKTDEELVALSGVGEASVAKIRAALGA